MDITIEESLKEYGSMPSFEKAEAGNLQEMSNFLSYLYQKDVDITAFSNELKAKMVGYARQLMDAGEASGYFYMAKFYQHGDVVPRDIVRAVKL